MTYKANFIKLHKDRIDILCSFSGAAAKRLKAAQK
jgi:hypothetical protein